jgi:hypothetical protein
VLVLATAMALASASGVHARPMQLLTDRGMSELAAPTAADALCGCTAWTRRFARSVPAQHRFDRDWRARGNVPGRSPIKRTAKRFGRLHRILADWCRDHPRECKAAVACVIYGGLAYDTAVKTGASGWTAEKVAVDTCVAAAVYVMLTG